MVNLKNPLVASYDIPGERQWCYSNPAPQGSLRSDYWVVLSLVKHLSYIVTYCLYLYIMRHLLTTMFSDYEEYTLYIC